MDFLTILGSCNYEFIVNITRKVLHIEVDVLVKVFYFNLYFSILGGFPAKYFEPLPRSLNR